MIRKDDALEAVKALLNPSTVAVIGASKDPRKFSGTVIPNLIDGGFKGKIYPVNPRRTQILGLKCYPSVKDVPDGVSVACIVTPSRVVPRVVEECTEKEVKVSVIITSGFGETGAEGKKVQDEIMKIARRGGMRICGPNCEGFVSPVTNTWMTMYSGMKPKLGNIALVTQSGGIGEFILLHMRERGVGLSHWISSGNEIDIQISDYIKYFAQDPYTQVISLFIESVRDGERFKEAAELAAVMKKPIVALKVGKSEKANLAALSHTGALTGSDDVYTAVFKQLGVIRVFNLDELFKTPMALVWQPLLKGDRIGLVTDSGGIAGLLADALEDAGLTLPNLTDETLQKLREILPAAATPKNPLDLTAAVTPEQYCENVINSLGAVAGDNRVDAIIIVITWWPKSIIAKIFDGIVKKARRIRELGKPVVMCFTETTPTLLKIAEKAAENKIPLYIQPEKAVTAMKAMADYQRFLNKRP